MPLAVALLAVLLVLAALLRGRRRHRRVKMTFKNPRHDEHGTSFACGCYFGAGTFLSMCAAHLAIIEASK